LKKKDSQTFFFEKRTKTFICLVHY